MHFADEILVANQVQEMDNIRRKLWDLEQAQIQMKKTYENEINTLRRELEARGGAHHMGGPGHNQPPPPQVGHGSSNHFGGIMAGGGAQGGPALAPPPQEPAQPPGLPGQMGHGPPGPPSGLPQPPAYGNFPQQGTNGKCHVTSN
jgi:general transcriptional corepressor TUP1